MTDYSHWSHWFPAHKSLTASQYNERAVLLARTLRRLGVDQAGQLRTNTSPDRQMRTAIGRAFDQVIGRRRVEARSGLRAALAADDRAFAGRLNRRVDVAILGQLNARIAAPRRRPGHSIHRMEG